jgi:hypothetical protein
MLLFEETKAFFSRSGWVGRQAGAAGRGSALKSKNTKALRDFQGKA